MKLLSMFSNARDGVYAQAVLEALDRSLAVIEFKPDGTILNANKNFLGALEYSLEELVGQHHRMLVPREIREKPDYDVFWKDLRSGNFKSAAFPRMTKSGKQIWIEATYNPVVDKSGKVIKIVKFASDITARQEKMADLEGKVDAIGRSQAVIEFTLTGEITEANENFLSVMGYSFDEIKGKQHRIFVDRDYANSAEYADFWKKLAEGQFFAQQFRRLGKGGKVVWIEASYNPIMDANGKPYKVVKFATDITEQVNLLVELKSMIDTNFAEIDSSLNDLDGRSIVAVTASEQTSASVQAVAAGAEELAASIGEISRSMDTARQTTTQMFDRTVEAGVTTGKMSDVVASVGGIVEVIQNIASQINLLALNATIESARAGEAGKGFAVVANEVKNLANQAARATEEISGQITGIQAISTEVAGVLSGIRSDVELVLDNVTTISSAVEEQSAVTNEVSGNMQNMATAVESFSATLSEIKNSTALVSSSVMRTREAASVLAR
ncbi:PAS domain-containing methyl-accepting chemotaxis protein [Thalassospira alkalitolerans]|uniref:methyl-accepting chemotaxis protein n=1 Tax=Thalassospira alkalitolerans TaxID=1293890 RepID=UPI0030EC5D4A